MPNGNEIMKMPTEEPKVPTEEPNVPTEEPNVPTEADPLIWALSFIRLRLN